MREDVQAEVAELWTQLNTDTLSKISDIEGFRQEFFNLFGFNFNKIDYNKDVETNIEIEKIVL